MESHICKEQERQRETFYVWWFTPLVAATNRSEPIQTKEPGTSSGSPIWTQGPKVLGHPWLLLQTICREHNESEATVLDPTPISDSGGCKVNSLATKQPWCAKYVSLSYTWDNMSIIRTHWGFLALVRGLSFKFPLLQLLTTSECTAYWTGWWAQLF